MKIKFKVDEKIYPIDTVIATSYRFLDKYYIFLDKVSKNIIEINIKSKKKIISDNIKDDFLNELMSSRARMNSAKRNKKIREFIVGRALFSVADENDFKEEYDKDDPLNIKMPWDDK